MRLAERRFRPDFKVAFDPVVLADRAPLPLAQVRPQWYQGPATQSPFSSPPKLSTRSRSALTRGLSCSRDATPSWAKPRTSVFRRARAGVNAPVPSAGADVR